MDELRQIVELIRSNGGDSEATIFPFWYVAVKGGGVLRRPVMISHGIWFSRETAEAHLKAKAHRYPKTAFVYCDSAHDSVTGLRRLFDIVNSIKSEGWES